MENEIRGVIEAQKELQKQIALAIQEELEKYRGTEKMEKTKHTSPDLLEACKWALAAERALPEGMRHPALERALEAAIAKAEGRE